MMSANAGLHADEAEWHIGQSVLKLATRELRFADNGSALVEANQVENSLAKPITAIDALDFAELLCAGMG
jgi:hypothetical protein